MQSIDLTSESEGVSELQKVQSSQKQDGGQYIRNGSPEDTENEGLSLDGHEKPNSKRAKHEEPAAILVNQKHQSNIEVDSSYEGDDNGSSEIRLQWERIKSERKEKERNKRRGIQDGADEPSWKEHLKQLYAQDCVESLPGQNLSDPTSGNIQSAHTTLSDMKFLQTPTSAINKAGMCQHQDMVWLPDIEFTVVDFGSNFLELVAFGKQFTCLLTPQEFSWVGILVILREALSKRRFSLIRHILSVDLAISPDPDQGTEEGTELYRVRRNTCRHARFTHTELRGDWLGRLILAEHDKGFQGICKAGLRGAVSMCFTKFRTNQP